MLGRLRARLTYANVASSIALFLALSTGAAYAANTVFSTDIVNGEVKTADLHSGAATTGKIAGSAVTGIKTANGTVQTVDLGNGSVTTGKVEDGTLLAMDLATGSVTGLQILDGTVQAVDLADDAVTSSAIQDNSIGSGEIVDFGLSNQDIGVLFAEVSASGVLDHSSGGVTVTKLGSPAGNYEVDFGHSVVNCTAVATIGSSGAGTATGEVNVADRFSNPEAVFVDTNTSAGAAADKAFRLVVVC